LVTAARILGADHALNDPTDREILVAAAELADVKADLSEAPCHVIVAVASAYDAS
jgi:hypothetical protein